jgi:hypothetical protein
MRIDPRADGVEVTVLRAVADVERSLERLHHCSYGAWRKRWHLKTRPITRGLAVDEAGCANFAVRRADLRHAPIWERSACFWSKGWVALIVII